MKKFYRQILGIVIAFLFLSMCMCLPACKEKMPDADITGKRDVNGDAGEASIKDALKVAKIINKKSNLGLDFLELADEERLDRIKRDSATSQPDIYSIDGTYCGWYSDFPIGSEEYRICRIKLTSDSQNVLNTKIGNNIHSVAEKLEPYGFVRGDEIGGYYFYEHTEADVYIVYYVYEDVIMDITLGISKGKETTGWEVKEDFGEVAEIINENSDMGFDLWEGVERKQVNLKRELGEAYDMPYPDDVYTEDYSACGTYIEDPVNDELYRICQIWIMQDTRNVLGTQVGDNIDSVDSIMREYDFVKENETRSNRYIWYWHKTQNISIEYNFGDDGEIYNIYVHGYPESPENINIGMTTDEVSQEQKESNDSIQTVTERSYDSFRDFPHGNMEYIDETAYAFLKDMYAGIEYKSKVAQGDLAVYDEYICKYEELLNNQITVAIPQMGEEYYVEDYVDMHSFFLNAEADHEVFNPHGFIYYLFDMDMDGTPELCMYNFKTYIFKYDKEGDSVILWKLIESPNETIHGSLSLRWNWDRLRYSYCELNPEAELTMGVYFLFYEYGEDAASWLVTVPTYYDEEKEIDIPQEMIEQAYFCEESGLYMFNVSEQQYDELTKAYFEAERLSEENLMQVSYTYDGLFNNGSLCEICVHNNNIWHLSD